VQLTFKFPLDHIMLLFGIFFYLSSSGAFFCMFEKGRLGIGKLRFDYKGSLLMIGKNFKRNICCVHKP